MAGEVVDLLDREALGKLMNYLDKAGLLLPDPGEMQGGFTSAGAGNEPATSDATWLLCVRFASG